MIIFVLILAALFGSPVLFVFVMMALFGEALPYALAGVVFAVVAWWTIDDVIRGAGAAQGDVK